MVTAKQTQRTSWILAEEDDLQRQVDAFLLDRQTRGLAAGTLRFYRQKLALFQTFCGEQDIGMVSHTTPTLIRLFLVWC